MITISIIIIMRNPRLLHFKLDQVLLSSQCWHFWGRHLKFLFVIVAGMTKMIFKSFNILIHLLTDFAPNFFTRCMNCPKVSDNDVFSFAWSATWCTEPKFSLSHHKLLHFSHFGTGAGQQDLKFGTTWNYVVGYTAAVCLQIIGVVDWMFFWSLVKFSTLLLILSLFYSRHSSFKILISISDLKFSSLF